MKAKREKVRENLLALTEQELAKVSGACARERKPLAGQAAIGLAAGRVVNRFGMAKYFRLHVGEHSLRFARRQEVLDRESATDGIYVIRTSETKEALSAEQAVATYKSLAKVERAFRCLKGVDLQVRPIHHRLEDRVKAHLFLCMLAYALERHLRQAWAGLLFHDGGSMSVSPGEQEQAQRAIHGEGGTRTSPVAPIQPSEGAKTKKRSPRANPDLPLQSYRGLLQSLSALTRATLRLGTATFTRCAKATPPPSRSLPAPRPPHPVVSTRQPESPRTPSGTRKPSLSRYGTSAQNGAAPTFITQASFDPAYEPVNATYPNGATGQWVVQAGDTLSSAIKAQFPINSS